MLGHPTTQLLSGHHDGELSPEWSSRIDEHLRECAACRQEYRHLERLSNVVRHLPRLSAPAELRANIRERVDAEVHGLVPVLRGQIVRSSDNGRISLPSFGLGTAASLLLLCVVLLFHLYGERATRQLSTALIPAPLPTPVLLHEPMSSPRFRYGSVQGLPSADIERGKVGTFLTLATIDQFGTVRGLEVVYRSGDEELLDQTLAALRASGFEPARLGDRTVAVDFLYLYTTTEVRAVST